MILYHPHRNELVVEHGGSYFPLPDESLDELLAHEELHAYLESVVSAGGRILPLDTASLRAPICSQEVWAAGVTYFRSRTARMEESKDAGGGSFYDRVYTAERPELFFKAMPYKVVGSGSPVHIRKDAAWSVPEPELALCVNSSAQIVGYTIGNDMSSRDIEGQKSAVPAGKDMGRQLRAGPALLTPEPCRQATRIQIVIERGEQTVFSGETSLAEMKRKPEELVEYLFRDQTFPFGCFLLTGTGIVPPDDFTLHSGDRIAISIDGIGTLRNHVA